MCNPIYCKVWLERQSAQGDLASCLPVLLLHLGPEGLAPGALLATPSTFTVTPQPGTAKVYIRL